MWLHFRAHMLLVLAPISSILCFLSTSSCSWRHLAFGFLLILSSATDLSTKAYAVSPIEVTFNLPSPLPTWPPGQGFANGSIDLGGLRVCQITSFTKIWASYEGGPHNQGATFFEPSQLPDGFFMLGGYAQTNSQQLFGRVLAGKDEVSSSGTAAALKQPIDYTLVWSSESLQIKKDGNGYLWLPTPPDGYKAIGYVVTNSSAKPSLDKIRCVRSDLTDQCEMDTWIWDADGFNFYEMRPKNRGVDALGVSGGTFVAQNGGSADLPLSCLKKCQADSSSSSSSSPSSYMPNLNQIGALVQTYAPIIYFHPDEAYLPSSVSWFFSNGALLYKNGDEAHPVPIDPTGSNLPQGGSDDEAYWLDLPTDDGVKGRVKKGDLQTSQAYIHVKPMLGGTFTDIAIWVFYPFNGPAKLKVKSLNIPLKKLGEHVGDWEHVTLRISNFNGELQRVYFSEHNRGMWMRASELVFQNGNKFAAYASLHGHALYPYPGLVLQGSGDVGLRNDAAKSDMVMDTGANFSVVATEYLGSGVAAEPPWLNYLRKWGPKVSYKIADELNKVKKMLFGKLRKAFEQFLKELPPEVLGEDGPAGPKIKSNWGGDEA